MKKSILVTDSLFIYPEHVSKLEAAGYEVERLDKPEATEAELVAAIKDKSAYILGGIETVTPVIIDAADQLEVIGFTGIDYKHGVAAWEYVTKHGIAITNTPDGPTQGVAEWLVATALLMNRDLIGLGRTGTTTFRTTKGLEGQKIGIVGLGRIGKAVASLVEPFRPAEIAYFSRTQDSEYSYRELPELLGWADIVFLCVSGQAGSDFIGSEELASMQDGALLVNMVPTGIVNEAALLSELKSGRLRAASDKVKSTFFSELPIENWYVSNESTAFNTDAGVKRTSDTVVDSIINILTTGQDEYLVNPEYKDHK